MASKQAIAVWESVYQRTDKQIREILDAQQPGLAEVDTINVVIGDGATVLTAGVAAGLRVDFNAVITGAFLHEFDGVTGSVVVAIAHATYATGSAPVFTSIVASAPPTISSARYGENLTLSGWTTDIARGDVLRFSITSATSITRVLVALRIRRLEP